MIYTIGNTESYNRYLSERETKKKGRTNDFCGGSVWLTKEEAQLHCREGYSVYGVLADWEKDTVQSDNGPWHDLLVDSVIVELEG